MEQYISNLNWFDITLISIVLISTIFAMFRGLIKALFSLITWVGSGSITLYLYPYSHEYLADKIDNQKLVIILSSLGVFLIVFIIIAIINSSIIHILRKQSGGLVDRALGMCFGAARGVLIVCLIFFSITLTSKMLHLGENPDRPGPRWFSNSGTYETLDLVTSKLLAFAPDDMPGRLEQTVNKFKDITLSAMGEELEASSGATKTLSGDQRALMKQIIATLPQEDLGDVYKKYDGSPSALSEFERVEIFRDIIAKYNDYIKVNKIAGSSVISKEKIQELEDSLNKGRPGAGATEAPGENEGLGYKDRNIKQLNRLIDGIN